MYYFLKQKLLHWQYRGHNANKYDIWQHIKIHCIYSKVLVKYNKHNTIAEKTDVKIHKGDYFKIQGPFLIASTWRYFSNIIDFIDLLFVFCCFTS